MPDLERRDAIETLKQAVRKMGPDDLLDFHNELFPQEPKSVLKQKDDVTVVQRKVMDYLSRGLEIEEILDLWNVAFPEDRNVCYDDETGMIHFDNKLESVHQAE